MTTHTTRPMLYLSGAVRREFADAGGLNTVLGWLDQLPLGAAA